jgi:hypothetical protein
MVCRYALTLAHRRIKSAFMAAPWEELVESFSNPELQMNAAGFKVLTFCLFQFHHLSTIFLRLSHLGLVLEVAKPVARFAVVKAIPL